MLDGEPEADVVDLRISDGEDGALTTSRTTAALATTGRLRPEVDDEDRDEDREDDRGGRDSHRQLDRATV